MAARRELQADARPPKMPRQRRREDPHVSTALVLLCPCPWVLGCSISKLVAGLQVHQREPELHDTRRDDQQPQICEQGLHGSVWRWPAEDQVWLRVHFDAPCKLTQLGALCHHSNEGNEIIHLL